MICASRMVGAFFFKLISDGTLGKLCQFLRDANASFGFESLSRTDFPVSPELILAYTDCVESVSRMDRPIGPRCFSRQTARRNGAAAGKICFLAGRRFSSATVYGVTFDVAD